MYIAAFVIDALMVMAISYGILRRFGSGNPTMSVVAFPLLGFTTIFLSTLILSSFGFISVAGYLVLHTAVLAVLILMCARVLSPTASTPPISLPEIDAVSKGFLALTIIIAIVNLLVALYFPPNNWDSMSYHLARVGHWLQNNSLSHYPTYDTRQLYSAPNSEIFILWTVVFLKTDIFANLIQWLMYVLLGCSIFSFCRLLNFTHSQSIFAGCLFMGLPQVMLQSTTTQNDLAVAYFAITWLLLLLHWLEAKSNTTLALAALALGLAIGTKGTIFYAGPALVVVGTALAIHHRVNRREVLQWAMASAIGIVVTGSYNYILNYFTFKNFLADPADMDKIHNGSFLHSLFTYLYQLLDFSGLPQFISKPLTDYKVESAAAIGNLIQIPVERIQRIASLQIHEDLTWFGPVGFIVFLVATHHLIRLNKTQPIKAWLTFVFVTFALTLSYLQAWSPWKGRYFILPMALIAPLMGSAFQMSRGKLRSTLTVMIVILSLVTSCNVLLLNERKPLEKFADISKMSRVEKQVLLGDRPSYLSTALLQETMIPNGSRVGLALKKDDWTYIFFGKTFSRNVTEIPVAKIPTPVDQVLEQHHLDWLVVDTSRSDLIELGKDGFVVPGTHNSAYKIYKKGGNYDSVLNELVNSNSLPKKDKRLLLSKFASGEFKVPKSAQALLETYKSRYILLSAETLRLNVGSIEPAMMLTGFYSNEDDYRWSNGTGGIMFSIESEQLRGATLKLRMTGLQGSIYKILLNDQEIGYGNYNQFEWRTLSFQVPQQFLNGVKTFSIKILSNSILAQPPDTRRLGILVDWIEIAAD